MEIDFFHAFFGRFGVLIPVLGLFFELGAIFTQKDLINKISGILVILGSVLVIFAFISGVIELRYLISIGKDLREKCQNAPVFKQVMNGREFC